MINLRKKLMNIQIGYIKHKDNMQIDMNKYSKSMNK